ncbi:MAG TPA: ABC transporter substrate-binding protein [Geminicoccus sp.]|jgi:peptide/nickel transport system substrate-binding protein|uniref:ABC transporter substrate-binding protein n=1 Tax=Geminicoccus sp. TaxID=2024832 RepID=UPI002E365D31|nr:ABC transporter substrate-binding protein [Geminicoccus sp.]HEX2527526.1 ABC transporter substrate-binding protein [Geminicoccus sp.]
MRRLDDYDTILRQGGLDRRSFGKLAAMLGAGASIGALMPGIARAQEEPKKGGDLSIGITGGATTDTLNPLLSTASIHAATDFMWGNCLVEYGTDGSAVPELAESWEPSADAKTWRFNIRKGVVFHNGKELDADDVVYSLNLHRGENSTSGAAGYMKQVSDVKADGKNVVVISLESGNADLPYLLTDYHMVIMPKDSDIASGIGTGAYKITEFDPGVRVFGVLNENYFKAGRGNCASVELVGISDPAARTAALQTGQITIMERVDPKTVELMGRAPGIVIHRAAGGGHYPMLMRCDTAPFDNLDYRLGLKYAANREDIVDKVLRGLGKPGNDHPIPSGDPFFAASLAQRPYDPEKAKFHMKKAGYGGEKIPLSTSDAAFSGAVDTAVLYQQHAAAAGINIDVIREPSDGYWDNVWMKKPFSLSYWGGRPTADLMLTVAYKSDAAWNDTFWRRPDFDKVLLEARAELDKAKRQEMYTQLQTMIHEDGGALIPMFNDFVDASTDAVKNFELSPQYGLAGMRAPERVWLDA